MNLKTIFSISLLLCAVGVGCSRTQSSNQTIAEYELDIKGGRPLSDFISTAALVEKRIKDELELSVKLVVTDKDKTKSLRIDSNRSLDQDQKKQLLDLIFEPTSFESWIAAEPGKHDDIIEFCLRTEKQEVEMKESGFDGAKWLSLSKFKDDYQRFPYPVVLRHASSGKRLIYNFDSLDQNAWAGYESFIRDAMKHDAKDEIKILALHCTSDATLNGSHITETFVSYDQHNRPALQIDLNREGSKRSTELTKRNVDNSLIFAKDGERIFSSIINGVVIRPISIQGNFKLEDLKRLEKEIIASVYLDRSVVKGEIE